MKNLKKALVVLCASMFVGGVFADTTAAQVATKGDVNAAVATHEATHHHAKHCAKHCKKHCKKHMKKATNTAKADVKAPAAATTQHA